jgi:hypothetical protein
MNGRDEQSARATRAQHEERVRYTERRGAGNGERPEAQDPRALEHTIERHRENIDQTLSALESKLSPNELIEKGLQHVVGGGGSLLESLKHTAREQPVPMALIGAGLAWLLFGPAKSGDAPARRSRHRHRGATRTSRRRRIFATSISTACSRSIRSIPISSSASSTRISARRRCRTTTCAAPGRARAAPGRAGAAGRAATRRRRA